MKVTDDFIQKLESLPEEKIRLIFSLVDQFANVNLASSDPGSVLSQDQIDHLIEDIRAGIIQ